MKLPQLGLAATVAVSALLASAVAIPAQAQAAPGGDVRSGTHPARPATSSLVRTALTTKAPYQPQGSIWSYQRLEPAREPGLLSQDA